MSAVYGAIEAGGTKFVLSAANSPGELNRFQIQTTTPEETLGQVVTYFRANPVDALGLACFGPVDLAQGVITETPKLAWRNFPIVAYLQDALGIPVTLDTDVNAAALGEQAFGAAQGIASFVYFTVGTGIGGAAIIDGHLLHGAMHAEMGHIPVRRHSGDGFRGVCPSHQDCLEGMAAGPAITA